MKPGDVFFREGPEEMTLEVLLGDPLLFKKGATFFRLEKEVMNQTKDLNMTTLAYHDIK